MRCPFGGWPWLQSAIVENRLEHGARRARSVNPPLSWPPDHPPNVRSCTVFLPSVDRSEKRRDSDSTFFAARRAEIRHALLPVVLLLKRIFFEPFHELPCFFIEVPDDQETINAIPRGA